MKKKEYVKPAICIVEIEAENIIATSCKFIRIGDEEADYEMEVLSKGRMGGVNEEENSWGDLW